MTAEKTLESLTQYCIKSSGNESVWHGKSATYQWNVGRENSSGLVNGVVRKLAGVDASGKQIWAVAGSFKINEYGTILRFTGLPKKVQKSLEPVHQTVVANPVAVTV